MTESTPHGDPCLGHPCDKCWICRNGVCCLTVSADVRSLIAGALAEGSGADGLAAPAGTTPRSQGRPGLDSGLIEEIRQALGRAPVSERPALLVARLSDSKLGAASVVRSNLLTTVFPQSLAAAPSPLGLEEPLPHVLTQPTKQEVSDARFINQSPRG